MPREQQKEEVVGLKDYSVDPEKVGDYGIKTEIGTIWGVVFVLFTQKHSSELTGLSSNDGEVINHRWVYPIELRTLPLRSGVLEPLKDFVTGQRGVVNGNCSSGNRP